MLQLRHGSQRKRCIDGVIPDVQRPQLCEARKRGHVVDFIMMQIEMVEIVEVLELADIGDVVAGCMQSLEVHQALDTREVGDTLPADLKPVELFERGADAVIPRYGAARLLAEMLTDTVTQAVAVELDGPFALSRRPALAVNTPEHIGLAAAKVGVAQVAAGAVVTLLAALTWDRVH